MLSKNLKDNPTRNIFQDTQMSNIYYFEDVSYKQGSDSDTFFQSSVKIEQHIKALLDEQAWSVQESVEQESFDYVDEDIKFFAKKTMNKLWD